MQRYLLAKQIRDQAFNAIAYKGGFWGAVIGAAYYLGYQIEALGQWISNDPDFRIRINPVTLDFKPIEKTLREFDEQGVIVF